MNFKPKENIGINVFVMALEKMNMEVETDSELIQILETKLKNKIQFSKGSSNQNQQMFEIDKLQTIISEFKEVTDFSNKKIVNLIKLALQKQISERRFKEVIKTNSTGSVPENSSKQFLKVVELSKPETVTKQKNVPSVLLVYLMSIALAVFMIYFVQ
eukprot:gene9090-1185_t